MTKQRTKTEEKTLGQDHGFSELLTVNSLSQIPFIIR